MWHTGREAEDSSNVCRKSRGIFWKATGTHRFASQQARRMKGQCTKIHTLVCAANGQMEIENVSFIIASKLRSM
jgi:hypothetical protein